MKTPEKGWGLTTVTVTVGTGVRARYGAPGNASILVRSFSAVHSSIHLDNKGIDEIRVAEANIINSLPLKEKIIF